MELPKGVEEGSVSVMDSTESIMFQSVGLHLGSSTWVYPFAESPEATLIIGY